MGKYSYVETVKSDIRKVLIRNEDCVLLTISFLGTGAGNCIHRSHTSMVLDWGNERRVMLDTGSGNSALINGAKLGIFSSDIHQILLSHGHFDHMGGLPHIQGNRTSVIPEANPLKVYASGVTLARVKNLFEATTITHTIDDHGASSASGERLIEWEPVDSGKVLKLGESISAYSFEVDHIPGTVGWRLECDGVSVVFSGDTRVCQAVSTAAQGADVLIHEALSTEDSSERTKNRGHSTAAEAGQIASSAGAKRLVMTHIDTKFHSCTEKLIEEAMQYYSGPIQVADDLTQIVVES